MRPQSLYDDAGDEEAEDRVFLAGFDSIQQRSLARTRAETRARLVKCAMLGCGGMLLALGLVLGISLGTSRSSHNLVQHACPQDSSTYDVSFLVVGDWGRQGNANQRAAAAAMANVAECLAPAFIISTGDNFYEHGLKSADDSNFHRSFVEVYSAPSLQVPWYAVLGNHDHGNGIDPGSSNCAATSLADCPPGCCYSPVWQYTGQLNDARWHCQNGTYMLPASAGGGAVEVLFFDSSPFITRYAAEPWFHNAGGLAEQDVGALREALLRRLASPATARWRLVVGHHPVASYGEHCKYSMAADCEDMAWLDPLMQASGVAAYLSGHDHDLQLIQRRSGPGGSPILPLYVVSGAGSDVRRGEFDRMRQKGTYELAYGVSDPGFVAVRANDSHLLLHFYVADQPLPTHTMVLAAVR